MTGGVAISGNQSSPPPPAWVMAIAAASGWLALKHLGGLLARLALAYKAPVEVVLVEDGLMVRARIELLGRVLRDQQSFLPRTGLVRATREVRFSAMPLYVGLLALALGSYIGVGLVVDGVRSASASLFGLGALVAFMGLATDFVLSSLVPGTLGRCRVLLVPRRGPTLCVAGVETKRADELLTVLGQQALRDPAPASGGEGKSGRASARPKSAVDEGRGAELPAQGAKNGHAQ